MLRNVDAKFIKNCHHLVGWVRAKREKDLHMGRSCFILSGLTLFLNGLRRSTVQKSSG
jgi:hypothetical protein